MKILLIGGTGTISTAISQRLADFNHELYLLNRGNLNETLPSHIQFIKADINNEKEAEEKLSGMEFDAVCDFIGTAVGAGLPPVQRKDKTVCVYKLRFRLQQASTRLCDK